jgi:hypothetical protein
MKKHLLVLRIFNCITEELPFYCFYYNTTVKFTPLGRQAARLPTSRRQVAGPLGRKLHAVKPLCR